MRGWIASAVTIALIAGGSAAGAASSCPNQITSCGCVIDAEGSYAVTADLNQAIIGTTCLEVDHARARLDLAGHSIVGASSFPPPNTSTLDLGIHLTHRASNAIVVGGGADISGFATAGIEIDSAGAVISDLKAEKNGDGIRLKKAREVQLTGIDASGNESNGMSLFRSSGNQLSNVTANGNSGAGILIFASSSRNRISAFQTDSNGEGVEIAAVSCGPATSGPGCNRPGGHDNSLIGGEASGNLFYGISLEVRTTTVVVDNSASMNGVFDLRDAAPNCARNLWFGNTFTTANPSGCIH